MDRTKDMTKGDIWKLLLGFSVPLILTSIGQQLYMIVDAAIVGRGVGVKALAAVGAADWCYWLILWTVTGLTQGFATFVARYFGNKNYHEMNKTISMSVMLCVVIGSVLTVVGMVGTKPILILLDTPADILHDATVYLLTMTAGTAVITAYNMTSAILRAFGDGKSPLIAMIIAAILNVGLDLLFVMVFHWGIFGAAFASVLSQLVSFIYCFLQVKKISCVKIEKTMWKPDFSMIKELLAFAVPLGLQHVVICGGGIVLQSTINLQGSMFVAGFTAVNKLYGLLECTAISFGIAFCTFFAQNYGAKQYDRVRRGVKTGAWLCVLSAVVVMALVFAFGKYMILIFLDVSKEGGAEAFGVAWKYLLYMSCFLVVLYLIHVFRNAFQGIGNSFWSMVSGCAELVVRVGMGKIVYLYTGAEVLYWVEPAAWIGALLFVMIPYYFKQKSLLQS